MRKSVEDDAAGLTLPEPCIEGKAVFEGCYFVKLVTIIAEHDLISQYEWNGPVYMFGAVIEKLVMVFIWRGSKGNQYVTQL